MNRYKKGIFQLACAAVILLALAISNSSAETRPRLRVVHAAPGLANIDVYINDTLFFDNIFYRYISDYVPINAGDQTIRVRPAQASPRDATVVEVSAPFNENQDYTIIAAGRQGDIQHWRLEDDNRNLPGTGSSKLKIVHAAIDTPSVEICLADVCHTLAFRTNTDYFLMDPGTYIPKVRLNGSDITYVETPPLQLLDNSVHTVFITGQAYNQPGLQLLYTFDAGEMGGDPYPPAPYPPGNGSPPEGYPPPPAYPPVSGAFLSPQLLGMLAGLALIVVGSVGFWLTRK